MRYVLCADPCESCPARGLGEHLTAGIWGGVDAAAQYAEHTPADRLVAVGEAIMNAFDETGAAYRESAVPVLAAAAIAIVDGACPKDVVRAS